MNAMCEAVKAAIEAQGPLTAEQLHELLTRNPPHYPPSEINMTLGRLGHSREIMRQTVVIKGREESVWRMYQTDYSAPAKATGRIFCSLRFPSLAFGAGMKFNVGFYQAKSAVEQGFIERSGEYDVTVRDITEVLREEMPLIAGKRVFLSTEPSLVLSDNGPFQVRFRQIASFLGIFSTDVPDCHRLVEQSLQLAAGQIREVPRGWVESAEAVAP